MAETLLFVSPLIAGAAAGLILAAFVAGRRPFPGAPALILLALAAAIWSLGYALEILVLNDSTTLFWAKTQYFGIVTIPVAWFLFAAEYVGSSARVARFLRYRALLYVVPLVTLLLVWTNEAHGLIWRQTAARHVGTLYVWEFQHGPWFWVYVTYGYLLVLAGSILLLSRLHGSIRLHRWQMGLVLLAMAIPWLGNLFYIGGFGLWPDIDLTPLSFVVATFLFAVSLARYHLGAILPIAHQTVFAGMADGVLVLDTHNRIVELNQAAERWVGAPRRSVLGKSLGAVLPATALPAVLPATPPNGDHPGPAPTRTEIAQEDGARRRFYEVTRAVLTGAYPAPVGQLVVLHDITQHKEAQASLEAARARLEQAVAERTEQLRQSVTRLQQELAQRTRAEQRLEESARTYQGLFENAGDAILVLDLRGNVVQANQRAARLLGYSTEQLTTLDFRDIVIPEQHVAVEQNANQVLNGQPPAPALRYLRTQNGAVIPVERTLVVIRDGEGRPTHFQTIVRDISERIAAEEVQDRLLAELRQSSAELRALTIRLQEVQETERRQLAAELHDSVGQNLTALNLNLTLVQHQLAPGTPDAVHGRLRDSLALLEQTVRQVRSVTANLHTPMLENHGLVAALDWHAQQYARRTGMDVRIDGAEFVPRLPAIAEVQLFRLVQEALSNVLKHARATRVRIQIRSSESDGCVTVEDDGQGFDPAAPPHPAEQPHWGHLSMQQRAISLGGELQIDSAPGGGTRVTVRFPR
jgi:PAS domain S-box-containing protein